MMVKLPNGQYVNHKCVVRLNWYRAKIENQEQFYVFISMNKRKDGITIPVNSEKEAKQMIEQLVLDFNYEEEVEQKRK